MLCIFLSIIIGGIENVCNKKLEKGIISITTQMYYIGITHCYYSILWMLFTNDFDYNVKYFLMYMGHAIIFFIGLFFLHKGLEFIKLSKATIFQYSKIVFVFILAIIFLRQKIFFTDVLGSSIIIGFMIYHVLNPLNRDY